MAFIRFVVAFLLAGLMSGSAAGSTMASHLLERFIGAAAPQLAVTGTGVLLNSVVYFTAETPEAGLELWRSNGTAEGTVIVSDIFPGPGGSAPTGLTVAGNLLYFQAEAPGIGRELWVSGGNAEDTRLVADIAQGPQSSWPSDIVAFKGRAFFRAYHPAYGWELWSSAGTAPNTLPVADIVAGAGNSFPASLTPAGPLLYFRAYDALRGSELWATDGTAAGTTLVEDIAPGPVGASPFHLNYHDGKLYFRIADEFGTTLWSVDAPGLRPIPILGTRPGQATLSWIAPTRNTDGTPIVDLAGYRIYYGRSAINLDQSIVVPHGAQLSYEFTDLPPGFYYFAATALNASGTESKISAGVSKFVL